MEIVPGRTGAVGCEATEQAAWPMCGIAGYFAYEGRAQPDRVDPILRMVRPLAVRGPDDEGLALFDPESKRSLVLRTSETAPGALEAAPLARPGTSFPHRVAFGHRRFSIIDPKPRGHQPFFAEDGSVSVIFNGEIYNYLELAQELRALGHGLRTECDTEVLVESYRRWGPDCFERFIGFWAVALYDLRSQRLLLARDRMGKAPLYVGRHGGMLYWSSEIKSLRAAPVADAFSVRPQAVTDFIVFGQRDVYDRTFYEGIETFPRASWAWIDSDGQFVPNRYWNIPSKRRRERDIHALEAVAELRETLSEALRVRLRADVPLAMHLSGGVDSSALVALAASQNRRLRSYTVSYPGTEADEEPYARQVAQRWNQQVDYVVITPNELDFFTNADWYVGQMDEPFHSPNMLAAHPMWRDMAGQGIRVSIDGGAADELLCGYVATYYGPYLSWLLERGRLWRLHREIIWLSEQPTNTLSRLYLRRLRGAAGDGFRRRKGVVPSIPPGATALLSGMPPPAPRPLSPLEPLIRENATDWLMSYWLRSGHQNFMSVPIEVRAPFLDHRVVECAFSLPVSYLIRDGWLKWILREAVRELLPEPVTFRRRKMGFPFPIESWLRRNERSFWLAIGNEVDTKGSPKLRHGSDECPFVNHSAIADNYKRLIASDPMMLWRAMAVCLWWRRCVVGESLIAP